jgi:hypothetical protein
LSTKCALVLSPSFATFTARLTCPDSETRTSPGGML